MKNIPDFIKRHSVWLLTGLLSVLLLSPAFTELRTILFITTLESLAIALSGVAAFVYTRINFSENSGSPNPGLIFLGVHICVGLGILGIYIVQFSA